MLGAANLGQIGLASITGATNATTVETIQLPGSPTGGSWTITYNGVTTGTMAATASAATVQLSLNALGSVLGNSANPVVTVTGTSPTYTVTFSAGSPLAKTGLPLIVNLNNLTGTGEPVQLQPALVTITTGSGTSAVQYGVFPTNLAVGPVLDLGTPRPWAPPEKAP